MLLTYYRSFRNLSSPGSPSSVTPSSQIKRRKKIRNDAETQALFPDSRWLASCYKSLVRLSEWNWIDVSLLVGLLSRGRCQKHIDFKCRSLRNVVHLSHLCRLCESSSSSLDIRDSFVRIGVRNGCHLKKQIYNFISISSFMGFVSTGRIDLDVASSASLCLGYIRDSLCTIQNTQQLSRTKSKWNVWN